MTLDLVCSHVQAIVEGTIKYFDYIPLSSLIATHVCTESQAQHRPCIVTRLSTRLDGTHKRDTSISYMHTNRIVYTNTALFRHTHYPLKWNASLYFCCSFGLLLCSSFFASLSPSLGLLLSSCPVVPGASTLLSSNSLFCFCLGVFLLACSSVLLHRPHVHAIKHQALQ